MQEKIKHIPLTVRNIVSTQSSIGTLKIKNKTRSIGEARYISTFFASLTSQPYTYL
jgi:hypothetical protein